MLKSGHEIFNKLMCRKILSLKLACAVHMMAKWSLMSMHKSQLERTEKWFGESRSGTMATQTGLIIYIALLTVTLYSPAHQLTNKPANELLLILHLLISTLCYTSANTSDNFYDVL